MIIWIILLSLLLLPILTYLGLGVCSLIGRHIARSKKIVLKYDTTNLTLGEVIEGPHYCDTIKIRELKRKYKEEHKIINALYKIYDNREDNRIVLWFCLIGVFACACGGIVMLCNCRGAIGSKELPMKLEEKIESLNNTYNYLINEDKEKDISRLDVVQYNKDVEEFTFDIKRNQMLRNNPWTSWFIHPIYNEIDLTQIKYIK